MKQTSRKNESENKRVTITDVARTVGMSKATVSLALNRSPLVAEKTRSRVLEAAELLGYRANYFARRLSTGKSEIIGLYILRGEEQKCTWALPSSWTFYNPILKSVSAYLSENNYRLQLEVIDFHQARDGLIANIIKERSLDGILLLVQDEGDYGFLEVAKNMRFPMAIMNGRLRQEFSSVKTDNKMGGKKVAKYLLGLGHIRIAHISGPKHDFNAVERKMGFMEALQEKGISLNPSYMKLGDWQIESGHREAKQLLTLNERPTAIFCANDHMAVGAMQAVEEFGLQIPQDVSIVGFDNIEICSFVSPKLTTMEQSLDQMAIMAVQEVLRQIREGTEAVNHTNLEPRFVARESCAPLGQSNVTSDLL